MLIHTQDSNNRRNREGMRNQERAIMHSTGYEFSMEQANYITLLIIDESGSMSTLQQATVESFNGLVKSILNDASEIPTLTQHMGVVTFEGNRILERLSLTTVTENSEIQELHYQPCGNTPLFDAMGISVTKLEQLIQKSGVSEEKVKVSVAIFTDGEENSSRQFTLGEIQRLIERLKLKGWEFSYYGTEHRVEEMAERLRMNRVERFEKSVHGIHNTMASYSRSSKMSKEEFIAKMNKG